MHEKEIRRLAYKQIKKVPGFKNLKRKEKKKISQDILNNIISDYDFKMTVDTKLNELTATPDIEALRGLMTLTDIQRLIEETERKIIKMPLKSRNHYLHDPELRTIDELLDNSILNQLLAWDGYTSFRHVLFPCHLLRAEILKSLKFPELSYRKFCEEQVKPLAQKANRTFIGLPLHRNQTITHGQLSTFRNRLEFQQLCNLTVYVIYLLFQNQAFDHSFRLAGLDSTDLAGFCNSHPLATIELPNGKKVRIYNELDADCGKRRKKRDKSEFFVGYRLHTLTAINPQTGQSCPLLTLAAPANHHDSLFSAQLVAWAQAIGLELQLVVGDSAYGDPATTAAMMQQHGVRLVTPPDAKVTLPEHVSEDGRHVFAHEFCETAMSYLGYEDHGHEFTCAAEPGACLHAPLCSRSRCVPLDSGYFGPIPEVVSGVDRLRDRRKHLERGNNLLKHREGLEPLRVHSLQGVSAVATFATMTNLLIEIAGYRKTPSKEQPQGELPFRQAA